MSKAPILTAESSRTIIRGKVSKGKKITGQLIPLFRK